MQIKYYGGLEDLSEYKYIYQRDTFRRGNLYYKFVPKCSVCGNPFFMRATGPTTLCSRKCQHDSPIIKEKISVSGKNRIMNEEQLEAIAKGRAKGKGGVIKRNVPVYDTYATSLFPVEEVRREEGSNLLQVKCSNCKEWFTPRRTDCDKRSMFIRGVIDRESRFYCSDKCKYSCAIFHKKKWASGDNPRKHRNNRPYTESELRTWSKEVLSRANYLCEFCGADAKLAHHIEPKKKVPFFALDPDNGVACCEECHIKRGHIDACSFIYLASLECIETV